MTLTPTPTRGANIRAETMNKNSIEIKRKYVHKNYKYPNLYDNIVLLELGRRIIFDYDNVSLRVFY